MTHWSLADAGPSELTPTSATWGFSWTSSDFAIIRSPSGLDLGGGFRS